MNREQLKKEIWVRLWEKFFNKADNNLHRQIDGNPPYRNITVPLRNEIYNGLGRQLEDQLIESLK